MGFNSPTLPKLPNHSKSRFTGNENAALQSPLISVIPIGVRFRHMGLRRCVTNCQLLIWANVRYECIQKIGSPLQVEIFGEYALFYVEVNDSLEGLNFAMGIVGFERNVSYEICKKEAVKCSCGAVQIVRVIRRRGV